MNITLLDIIILILVAGWIGGISLHVAGSLIHLLLVIAVVVFIYRLVTGRRA